MSQVWQCTPIVTLGSRGGKVGSSSLATQHAMFVFRRHQRLEWWLRELEFGFEHTHQAAYNYLASSRRSKCYFKRK